MGKHVAHDLEVDLVVAVDQDVPEAAHRAQPADELGRQPSRPLQEVEQLPLRARLAETLVGDHVPGRVDGSLDGDLERVLDEALFTDVAAEPGGIGVAAQLLEARLDPGQDPQTRSGSVVPAVPLRL